VPGRGNRPRPMAAPFAGLQAIRHARMPGANGLAQAGRGMVRPDEADIRPEPHDAPGGYLRIHEHPRPTRLQLVGSQRLRCALGAYRERRLGATHSQFVEGLGAARPGRSSWLAIDLQRRTWYPHDDRFGGIKEKSAPAGGKEATSRLAFY